MCISIGIETNRFQDDVKSYWLVAPDYMNAKMQMNDLFPTPEIVSKAIRLQ